MQRSGDSANAWPWRSPEPAAVAKRAPGISALEEGGSLHHLLRHRVYCNLRALARALEGAQRWERIWLARDHLWTFFDRDLRSRRVSRARFTSPIPPASSGEQSRTGRACPGVSASGARITADGKSNDLNRRRRRTRIDSGTGRYSRIVASLDRKRLGADCWGGAGSRSEAFSIRRLGGSRWRLRRTRCAMGFERQLDRESRAWGEH